ncbi:RnfH family protein [Ferribacterium limneticum]|uniref:RnfH family protein n=1 Tax=Ferribacterium limneticum TaxID=76259 RepID=UPI001CF8A6B2|nr:RnfH family protein [Ferribacterium limneticum]UCV21984.1 RnfH family protein [Ferribacterium limneticum]
MQISVTYSEPSEQTWLSFDVPEDADVRAAIERSGILKLFPLIDLDSQKVGVFGRLKQLDDPLKPGDRVEIYRRVICDPKAVLRRDNTVASDN